MTIDLNHGDPDDQRLRYFHMSVDGFTAFLRAHARGISTVCAEWPDDARVQAVRFDKDLLCIRVYSKTFDAVEADHDIPHFDPQFKVVTPGGRKVVRGSKKGR